MKIIKYILIGLGVIFATYLGKAFLGGFSSSFAPDKIVNKAKQPKGNTQTFTSVKGSFAIDLPSGMKMYEKPERLEDGVTKGEVWFTFINFDENTPSGLVVVYGKPIIYGKGGGCGVAYKTEVISGQKVQVCEMEGSFRAGYFTHANKKIEYEVNTARLNPEQAEVVGEAVRETLRFE